VLFNIQSSGLFSLNTTSTYSQYYIVLSTCFAFTKTFSGQYSVYGGTVHSVCTYIMGSHSVYRKSYTLKILISSLKSIDRMNF